MGLLQARYNLFKKMKELEYELVRYASGGQETLYKSSDLGLIYRHKSIYDNDKRFEDRDNNRQFNENTRVLKNENR